MKEGQRKVPWASVALILVNIGLAVPAIIDPTFVDRMGFSSQKPDVLRAGLSLVLHANLWHLLGNMLFLAAVGPLVELAAGRARLLLTYLGAGLFGVLAHFVMTRGTDLTPPLVGASGAIAGLVAYAALRYMNWRVPVLPKVGVPVFAVALLWVGLQAAGAFLGNGEAGGTAYWAHLGGFLGGVLLAIVLGAPKQASLSLGHDVLEQMNHRGPVARLAAAEEVLKQHPTDAKALRERALALGQLGEVDREYAALVDWLDKRAGDAPEVVQMIASIHAMDQLPAARRMRLAHDLEEGAPECSVMLLESLVDDAETAAHRPDALLMLAEVLRTRDPGRSAALLAELEAKYALHGAAQVARQKGLIS